MTEAGPGRSGQLRKRGRRDAVDLLGFAGLLGLPGLLDLALGRCLLGFAGVPGRQPMYPDLWVSDGRAIDDEISELDAVA